ncbi:phosphoribosyltransferase [Burkholderia alba]|uniref:phosphoribosyltransferase n=1 Tax=Burkholderia alba TaxID=2683677 RepID=UPI002B05961F|nr:phosphoribosyltransferase family protein [Burkholderia alba]
MHVFKNRLDAGRQLAQALPERVLAGRAVVLALPRGGVPVGWEVARARGLPFDICVVRKLGVPGHRELAMGAIAANGVLVVERGVVAAERVSDAHFTQVLNAERDELTRREARYRAGEPPLDLAARTVIVVDDGMATGASLKAALRAIRAQRPAMLVVAVPVAPAGAAQEFDAEPIDAFVCLRAPSLFFSVGQYYEDFREVDDTVVRACLDEARRIAQ